MQQKSILALGLALGPAVPFTVLSGCASTRPLGVDREPAARGNVHLDLQSTTTDGEPRRLFPSAIEPRLPSVDRISHQVRARLGEISVAAVELCVAPDGHVTRVALLEGTHFAAFDAALVRDAQAWRFAASPGRTATGALQTCERARVKYLAP
jgi:TonB family protein